MTHTLTMEKGKAGTRWAACSCGWRGEVFTVGTRPHGSSLFAVIETAEDAEGWAVDDGSEHVAWL